MNGKLNKLLYTAPCKKIATYRLLAKILANTKVW